MIQKVLSENMVERDRAVVGLLIELVLYSSGTYLQFFQLDPPPLPLLHPPLFIESILLDKSRFPSSNHDFLYPLFFLAMT